MATSLRPRPFRQPAMEDLVIHVYSFQCFSRTAINCFNIFASFFICICISVFLRCLIKRIWTTDMYFVFMANECFLSFVISFSGISRRCVEAPHPSHRRRSQQVPEALQPGRRHRFCPAHTATRRTPRPERSRCTWGPTRCPAGAPRAARRSRGRGCCRATSARTPESARLRAPCVVERSPTAQTYAHMRRRTPPPSATSAARVDARSRASRCLFATNAIRHSAAAAVAMATMTPGYQNGRNEHFKQ